MALKDDIALLSAVPAFEGLADEQLRLIAFGAEHRRLADGERLFAEGAPADCAYVVVSGTIRLFAADREGEPQPAGIAEAGSMLSDMAMILATQRRATAIADGPVEVIRIARALFHRMVEEYPEVGRMTEARLRARFTAMAERLAALSGRLQG